MSATATRSRRVIAGGTILAGEHFEVIPEGFVVVEDGRIVEIGAGRPPDGLPGWDARGTVIVPAFLNAHTHVSDSFLKEAAFGRPHWEAVMPPDGIRHKAFQHAPVQDIQDAIETTLDQMVSCGTSTFVDFREGGLEGVRLLRKAAVGRPLRALALGRFRQFPPQPLEMLERNEGSLDAALRQQVLDVLEEADGFSCVSANDLTDAALADLSATVRPTGRLLATHVTESAEYRSVSRERTGQGDVERVLAYLKPDFVVHLTDATERELDLLAKARMPAVVCPRIQGVMGLGVPRFDLMMERGMTVALGTDNVFLSSPDLLRELDYSSRAIRAVRRSPAFPSAVQMLQMITVNPAKLLNRWHELGSIDNGKFADLVIFDPSSGNLRPMKDPVASIVNRAESRDIRAVFHGGALVHGTLEQRAP